MSYFCIFMNLNAYHSEIWLVFFNNLRAVPTAINTSFLSALKKPPRKRKLKAALESTKKEKKKRLTPFLHQETISTLGTRHEEIAIFALGRNDRRLALIARRAHLQAAAPAVGRP